MNKVFAIASVVIKELIRRKDFYVLFVLTGLITALMASVNIFKEDNALRDIQDICLSLIWLSGLIIAVGTTARQIPMERENRTIFPLLAKPVTRAQVILGKFLGCWFACGGALLLFYACFVILSGSREHEWRLGQYFLGMWMQWMFLGVVISMVLWGSVVFAAPSSNATIVVVLVIGILFLGKYLRQIGTPLGEPMRTVCDVIYFTIPQLYFFNVREMVVQHRMLEWIDCAGASVYGLGYMGIFLMGAWFSFRRKPLQT
jgi:ABC-type transport system involved in multi-copper enzyme maturation permease subunit